MNAPGLFIGGWYDIFLQGTINSFVAIHNYGGPNARGRCRLIIAPNSLEGDPLALTHGR